MIRKLTVKESAELGRINAKRAKADRHKAEETLITEEQYAVMVDHNLTIEEVWKLGGQYPEQVE